MDLEKLIKEQQKTNQILSELRDSKSFEEFLEKTEEVQLDWNDSGWHIPDDDFSILKDKYSLLVGQYIFQATQLYGKAKTLWLILERRYKYDIQNWEEYRKTFKNDDWIYMYINPTCLKFFYDYEKYYGIKNSIFQEAYSIIKKKKPKQLINDVFEKGYKPTKEEKEQAFKQVFNKIEGKNND